MKLKKGKGNNLLIEQTDKNTLGRIENGSNVQIHVFLKGEK